jgi:excisionase family DNA binding protein
MPKTNTVNAPVDDADDAVSEWRQRLEQLPTPRPVRAKVVRDQIEPPRTIGQAAEELGLSVHTVRAWVAERRLTHLRLGRAIRIPAAEIRRVIDESTIPAKR